MFIQEDWIRPREGSDGLHASSSKLLLRKVGVNKPRTCSIVKATHARLTSTLLPVRALEATSVPKTLGQELVVDPNVRAV